MDVNRIEDFTRGWIIGNFAPSLLRTKDFEVALLSHKKDEEWPAHYHKVATEYNLLVSGTMLLNDRRLVSGDIFTIYPMEVAIPKFLSDCYVLCIKTPSVPGDKSVVQK